MHPLARTTALLLALTAIGQSPALSQVAASDTALEHYMEAREILPPVAADVPPPNDPGSGGSQCTTTGGGTGTVFTSYDYQYQWHDGVGWPYYATHAANALSGSTAARTGAGGISGATCEGVVGLYFYVGSTKAITIEGTVDSFGGMIIVYPSAVAGTEITCFIDPQLQDDDLYFRNDIDPAFSWEWFGNVIFYFAQMAVGGYVPGSTLDDAIQALNLVNSYYGLADALLNMDNVDTHTISGSFVAEPGWHRVRVGLRSTASACIVGTAHAARAGQVTQIFIDGIAAPSIVDSDVPETGTVGRRIVCFAKVEDPNGDEVQCWFDWGDGSPLTCSGATVGDWIIGGHEYASAGTYPVSMQAEDLDQTFSDWTAPVDIIISDVPPPNQSPFGAAWQVSPDSGPWTTPFDYSIYVDDPDGDSVDVVLETRDPSSGTWENQDTRTVSGTGTATWSDRTPFESDDAGLSGQYRFSYDDHEGHVGTWGPYDGPSLAGSEPDTEITSGPSGAIGYDDVTFTWTGYDDVTPTEDLNYSYILEGHGDPWSSWAPSTTKDYTDLPYGEYTFRVKARDTDLNEDPTPDGRTFVVGVAPGEIVPWPTFAANLHRTSHIDMSTGTGRITEPRERWRMDLEPWSAFRSNYVVADVDADGYAEIVVGTENPHGPDHRLYVLDGLTGEVEWYYECYVERVCVENVDGDPQLEIFAAGDGLYCLEWDGTTGTQHWHWPSAQLIHACPAVSDVDFDDTMEVLVANGDLVCLNAQTGAQEWSYRDVIDPDASIWKTTPAIASWNQQIYVGDTGSSCGVRCLGAVGGSPTLYWSYPTSYYVCSIALADVDNDGVTETLALDEGGNLHCLQGELPEWDVNTGDGVGGDGSTPAIANLDDDPFLEIVVVGQSYVHCYDGGSLGVEQWSYPRDWGAQVSPPVIADIDGDGHHEVICGSWYYLYCLDGTDGSLKWSMDFSGDDEGYLGRSPIAVGDPDNDGELELVVGGADIFVIDGPILVKSDGTGDYATIQAAINAADDGEIVWLADGTYTGDGNRDLDFDGKAITVRSVSGNPMACIIDCQGSEAEPHRGFYFHNDEGADSILQGITITNGYAAGTTGHTGYGGGIFCENATLTLQSCMITNCYASLYGGALAIYADTTRSGLLVADCAFSGNMASLAGGALYLSMNGTPYDLWVKRCVFSDNAAGWGHAIRTGTPHAWMNYEDCLFTSHNSPSLTTGVVVVGGYTLLDRCVFTGNAVLSIKNEGGVLYLDNATIVNNGDGPQIWGNGYFDLDKTIIAFNDGYALTTSLGSGIEITCCDIYGNADGDWIGDIADQLGVNGNISADPLFCDTTYGDFHLREPSPCAPGQQSGCDGPIGAFDVGCIWDCNNNDIDDAYDMANCPPDEVWCDDCNENGILDECDIADGTSQDVNDNGIPDECEGLCPGDLNGDGQRDQSDLGILLASYNIDAGGDIDGDGDTDQADLGVLLAVYDIPCP
ncbi:MAG: PQQ-binding-like beta-propeller repeat protein [Phycisphaerales bacterium]|nr:PQQ-binding-like beta-propeller repeat protein [Phycisphaerales bacterium]